MRSESVSMLGCVCLAYFSTSLGDGLRGGGERDSVPAGNVAMLVIVIGCDRGAATHCWGRRVVGMRATMRVGPVLFARASRACARIWAVSWWVVRLSHVWEWVRNSVGCRGEAPRV